MSEVSTPTDLQVPIIMPVPMPASRIAPVGRVDDTPWDREGHGPSQPGIEPSSGDRDMLVDPHGARRQVVIVDPLGLHLRPAFKSVTLAWSFRSDIGMIV